MTTKRKQRSGAEKKRARRRRREREAEWLGHFGPELAGRDVAWSSISPTPKQQ